MQSYYDVVVAGGSISGLLCAREVASAGYSVLVVEKGDEIGTPEHCGGLVSSAGLEELGVALSDVAHTHEIARARITAPDGASIIIDSKRQKVLGIDRRALDKLVAHQAQKTGATIRVKTTLHSADVDRAKTSIGEVRCRITVDARGAASPAQRDRGGVMPTAQYEVYADWIEDGTVEIMPDQERYPGFFAWIIPSGGGRGRVGVAGRGINVAEEIDLLLERRGSCSIIRKVFAPVWIMGPIKKFVDGGAIVVGDAAGQAKPTTAGGIFSSGMGGILAGRSISQYLEAGCDDADQIASSYQKAWASRFGREFEKQLLARRILERTDNKAISEIIGSVTPDTLKKISDNGDFDFHVRSIAKLLSVRTSIRAARSLVGSEIRRLLD